MKIVGWWHLLGEGSLRARCDLAFISGVIFTVAFLCLVPASWNNAHAGRNSTALAHMGPGFADYAVLLGQSGVADLALITAMLIVVWMGYVKGLRWTWFVMLIVVWGWAFPPLVLPNRLSLGGFDSIAWISLKSLRLWERGPVSSISIFVLMLAGLVLPVRSFFGK